MEKPSDLRSLAVSFVTAVTPSFEGDEWFDSVLCQGRLPDPRYLPGPDLCHWLLWKLGCRDSRILCRDVPESGIRYTGKSIDVILQGAQRMAAWRPFVLENGPLPGDILLTGSTTRGEPRHINMFLNTRGKLWTTVDIVACEKTGRWIVTEVVRELNGYRMVERNGVSKQLNGWVDVCSITYDALPGSQLV